MKKTLSFLLSLIMLVTIFAGVDINAYAANTFTSGGLTCVLDDDGVMTVSVTSGGNGRGADYANSPSNRAPWYTSYRSKITSVVIEDGVIAIGAYWFYNCTNLASVTVSDTVDTIGDCCFRSCTGLTGIELPSNCSWYYKELFLDCTSLKWAIMPYGNSTDSYSGMVPDGTFSGCTALEQVYIGSGHTALDAKAFYNCSKLTHITFNSGTISSVGTNALYNVAASCAFMSEDDSISSWCSNNGYALDSVTGVCSDNTYSSEKLTYTYNPSTMAISFTGSGDMAAADWKNYKYLIKSVDFSGTDAAYSTSFECFQGAENNSSINFSSTLTSIGWGSFAENYAITVLDFPASLENIWNYAFINCTSLDHINFADNGTADLHIYSDAFENCTASTYWLNLPANTRYVDDAAFYNTNFNYVKIYSDNITMGSNVFKSTYARFFTNQNADFYSWVKTNKNENACDWWCYCLSSEAGQGHNYVNTYVAPTCTEQGCTLYYCPYCDADSAKTDFVDSLGHAYAYTGVDNNNVICSCTRCGETDIKVDILGLETGFSDAISHENDNTPYNQSNYNGAYDFYTDGYINAKDFLLFSNAINNLNITNKMTTIDTSTAYQTIEGFGASACWWSRDVGGWDNIDDIMSLLYSKENGIGLNIYRYNLGSGSQDDTYISDWHRRGEDFLSSSSDINNASTYDWDADLNARLALKSAQSLNSSLKVTLFSNSAPVSLTENGKGYVSYGAASNLSSDNYQKFADYVVNCAEHFIEEGYNVTSVSPINEPEWSWTADENGYASQEGCHFTADAARTFYNTYMIPALQSSSLNGKVDLSVWECAQLNHSSSDYYKLFLPYMFSSATSAVSSRNYASYNGNIRSYCDSLDTHSYWASTSDRTSVASDLSSSNYSAVNKVRCTEYCQMTNDGSSGVYGIIQSEGGTTNGMTIEYGLALADIIYQDMTILNAVEWDWWTACSSGIYPDGLVYINYNEHNDIQTSKRLWCMGNYSKFIDEGAVRVGVTAGSALGANLQTNVTYSWSDGTDKNNYLEQSAYVNPDKTVVVVYINNSDTNEYTAFDSSIYSTFSTYVTDETHDLELYQTGSTASRAVSIPAKSVTTVVLNPVK